MSMTVDELRAVLPEQIVRFYTEAPPPAPAHLGNDDRRAYGRLVSDMNFFRFGRPALPVGAVRDVLVGGVRCRLYEPVPGPTTIPGALQVQAHGGGFVGGSIDERVVDAHARRTVVEAGVAVLTVDYRLAPVHGFHDGLNDILAVAQALTDPNELNDLGHDPTNVSLAGGSAGANLIAAAALSLGEKAARWRGVVLNVPPMDLDPRHFPPGARELPVYAAGLALYLANRAGFANLLTATSEAELTSGIADGGMEMLLAMLPDSVNQLIADPLVSPINGDVSNFPPAGIWVAEYDPLRPSGEAFAAKLWEAGRSVELTVVPGGVHGAGSLDGIWPPAAEWLSQMTAFTRRLHEGSR
jgi:acetyl esterase